MSKKCKFYSDKLKVFIEGVVVKENEKSVWIEIPNSYKVVEGEIPLDNFSKVGGMISALGNEMGLSPNFKYKRKVLDKGVPNIIKKKKSQVTYYA